MSVPLTIATHLRRIYGVIFALWFALTLLLLRLDMLWFASGSGFVTLTSLIYYREMIETEAVVSKERQGRQE